MTEAEDTALQLRSTAKKDGTLEISLAEVPIPKPEALPQSIMGDADDADIVDGPLALVPNVRHADEVIAS